MVTLWQTNSLLWKINIFRRSTIDGDYSWQIPKWSFAGKIMENPPKKMEGFGHIWSVNHGFYMFFLGFYMVFIWFLYGFYMVFIGFYMVFIWFL